MGKVVLRATGVVMLVVAIAVFAFALGHPGVSFPWSNFITYAIYALYLGVTAWLLLAPRTI